jgi:hypothetical protein
MCWFYSASKYTDLCFKQRFTVAYVQLITLFKSSFSEDSDLKSLNVLFPKVFGKGLV